MVNYLAIQLNSKTIFNEGLLLKWSVYYIFNKSILKKKKSMFKNLNWPPPQVTIISFYWH